MKASVIVAILLRIFAIHWAVSGIVVFLSFLGMNSFSYLTGANSYYWLQVFISPAFYFILAGLAWFFASLVARTVVPISDPELEINGITPKHLYSLGILVVGLIFFLKNLTPLMNWIHMMVLYRDGDQMLNGQSGGMLYKLTESLVPCVMGGIFALKAPAIADLIMRHNSREKRPESETE